MKYSFQAEGTPSRPTTTITTTTTIKKRMQNEAKHTCASLFMCKSYSRMHMCELYEEKQPKMTKQHHINIACCIQAIFMIVNIQQKMYLAFLSSAFTPHTHTWCVHSVWDSQFVCPPSSQLQAQYHSAQRNFRMQKEANAWQSGIVCVSV